MAFAVCGGSLKAPDAAAVDPLPDAAAAAFFCAVPADCTCLLASVAGAAAGGSGAGGGGMGIFDGLLPRTDPIMNLSCGYNSVNQHNI